MNTCVGLFKTVSCAAVVCAFTFASNMALAQVIYSEDFSSDPNFTLSDQFGLTNSGTDSATWNSAEGIYEMYMREYSAGFKFAVTPVFPSVHDTSFKAGYDLKFVGSVGAIGMDVAFSDGPIPLRTENDTSNWTRSYHTTIFGETTGYVRVADIGHEEEALDLNEWYTFLYEYDANTGLSDYHVSRRSNGDVVLEWLDVAAPMEPFDRVAFGSATWWTDGVSSEAHFDNVFVQTVPEPSSVLLLTIGAGIFCTGLRISRSRKRGRERSSAAC